MQRKVNTLFFLPVAAPLCGKTYLRELCSCSQPQGKYQNVCFQTFIMNSLCHGCMLMCKFNSKDHYFSILIGRYIFPSIKNGDILVTVMFALHQDNIKNRQKQNNAFLYCSAV